MSMLGFQTLKCSVCGHSNVIQVGELVWQEGKGQSLRPIGYYCATCMEPFNTEAAIRKIKAGDLREKIKELESLDGR